MTVPRLVQPGEPAPDFALPAVNRDGVVTLADFRGAPFLLGLFRSFECPFCRRLLGTLTGTAERLRAAGVACLAVTTSPPAKARLYYRYHPAGVPLACDPELAIHRAYGLPLCEVTTEKPTAWPVRLNLTDLTALRINPTGELPQPLSPIEAGMALDRIDGFAPLLPAADDPPADRSPLSGYFLIDRDGLVRWVFVEARDDPAAYGRHPSDGEIAAAARALAA